jgi:hypothetical protein
MQQKNIKSKNTNIFENGRQAQFFLKKGRQPQFFLNGRQPETNNATINN